MRCPAPLALMPAAALAVIACGSLDAAKEVSFDPQLIAKYQL